MDFDQLFGSLEEQYGLPKGYLSRTRQIESGGGKNVYNPNSRAAGDFQFIPSTAKAYGLTDPYDLQKSADAAARLARDNQNILKKNGIENPTGAQLYLAHQQGAGGAVKLLKAGETPAANVVGKNAVNWNGGDASVTGPQFAQRIQSKFDYGTKPGGYAYSAAGGLNSPRENIAMANQPSAASTDDDFTKLGDAKREGIAGLLDTVNKDQVTNAAGLLGKVTKQDEDATNANNQQTQMLWQLAQKGGNTQPMRPFTGFGNIFGNGLLG